MQPPCPVLLVVSQLGQRPPRCSRMAVFCSPLRSLIRPPIFPRLTRGIPVEVVTEPPVPEKRPVVAGASEKSPTPREATQDRSGRTGEPGQQQAGNDRESKPENKLLSGPGPGAKPAAPPASAKRVLGAPNEASHKEIARGEFADKDGQAETASGGIGNRLAAGGSLALPFNSGPDRFRAVAVPLPSYRFIVGGVLERVKHYPKSALQRRAKGIATIGFVLDESGGVASVVLLRSSGEADLDAESVALVNRAAPFPPPPPPGAQQSFAIEVSFGMGR